MMKLRGAAKSSRLFFMAKSWEEVAARLRALKLQNERASGKPFKL
jgi:hypothetical protein